jgi:hypothetical protein
MSQIIHLCVSVRGMLNWDKRYAKRMLSCVTKNDGSRYRGVEELRQGLMDELAMGHEVLPTGECDGFSYKTGCPGHPALPEGGKEK